MHLHVLPAGPLHTNAYLLTEPALGEAVLVDAPEGIWAHIAPLLAAEQCKLTELWLTHGHWDHIQGAAAVQRASGARVRAHADDRVFYDTPEIMEAFMGESLELEPVHVDAWVAGGDTFTALGLNVEIRHVPGHCPGNILFYLPQVHAAFVGDALFAGSVGRTDLPGGNTAQLVNSIRTQIYTLPAETQVLPGHGGATTVGHERAHNPYVHD